MWKAWSAGFERRANGEHEVCGNQPDKVVTADAEHPDRAADRQHLYMCRQAADWRRAANDPGERLKEHRESAAGDPDCGVTI